MNPDQLDSVKLNTAVAAEIFGYKILGETNCWYCEGIWHVYPDGSRWVPYDAQKRPVHVHERGCYCNNEVIEKDVHKAETSERAGRCEREFFAGHEAICLTAVEDYCEWIQFAFDIVGRLKPCSFSLHYLDGEWIAEMHDAISKHESRVKGLYDNERAAATAICRVGIKIARSGNIPKC